MTKNHKGNNADESIRRVCVWNEEEDTVSPLDAKRPTLPALGRFERLAEAFKSGEEKAGNY